MSKENTHDAQIQGIKTQVENFLKLIRQPDFLKKIETDDPEALRELLNFGNFSKIIMGKKLGEMRSVRWYFIKLMCLNSM